jgi:hypothetical protein
MKTTKPPRSFDRSDGLAARLARILHCSYDGIVNAAEFTD